MAGVLVTAGLFTSCLEDHSDIVLSGNAVITSFSFNDIKTSVPSKTPSGKDTTETKVTYGSAYIFAIDHLAGKIYNVDSLPKGTDVTGVTVNLGYEGGYVYYYQGEETKPYIMEDSIDFSNPVRFVVNAADGSGSRSYFVHLNVHKSESDSLVWIPVKDNNFHAGQMTAEKMLQLRDYMGVFGEKDGVPTVMAGEKLDKFRFSPKEWPLLGITGQVDYSSIVACHGVAYLLTKEGKLYSSVDMVEWNQESPERTFTSMVGVADSMLYLNEGGTFVACKPHDWRMVGGVQHTHDWLTVQTVDENLFPVSPSVVSVPLRTNPSIVRTTLFGYPRNYTGKYVSTWSKLSNDSVWTYYNPIEENLLPCPQLERLTVINFNGNLYAFGGAAKDGSVEAFEAMFQSVDGGITWRKLRKKIGLPQELKGYTDPYACVVDENETIWLMCSNGLMFKGRIGG